MENKQNNNRFFTEVLQIKTLKWLQDNECTDDCVLLQSLPFVETARNKVAGHKADIALITTNSLHSYHVIPDEDESVDEDLLETLRLAAEVFDSSSVVVTPTNQSAALSAIPNEIGVILIDTDGVARSLRQAKDTPSDAKSIANLLTKADLLQLYTEKGLKGLTTYAKLILLEIVDDYLAIEEVKAAVIASLLIRNNEEF